MWVGKYVCIGMCIYVCIAPVKMNDCRRYLQVGKKKKKKKKERKTWVVPNTTDRWIQQSSCG